MKHTIILTLVALLSLGNAMAQRPTPKNRLPKRIPAAQNANQEKRDVGHLFTDSGIDVLRFGQKINLHPPTGSLYDKAVKDYTNEFGVDFYKLTKGGKEVGRVAVSDGKIEGIFISSPDAHTDNGIHPDMLLTDAMKMDGVVATLAYDEMEGEFTIEILYGHILLGVLASIDMSATGVQNKLIPLEEAYKARSENPDGSDYPTMRLDPDDILEIPIFEIGLGIRY